jgi:hypothetical protein
VKHPGQVVPGGRRKLFRVVSFAIPVLLFLLAGCQRWDPPAVVSFPDDPRVLHGDWDLHVTGVWGDTVNDFVLGPDAQRLVLRTSMTTQAFTADAAGDWAETDAAAFAGLGSAHYDATIDAFVRIRLDGAASRVRTIPLGGGAATEAGISLPAGYSVLGTAIGSGRSFVLARPPTGHPELFWWDSLTGNFGGQLALPRMRDGMKVSANGSIISFWDLHTYGVQVLRTADPARLHEVRLQRCRSNGLSEGSADGRWFAFATCAGNVHVVDLANPAAGSKALGIKLSGSPRFAANSPEFVWPDAGGRIHSHDVESGVRQVVFTLTGPEVREDYHLSYVLPYLDRDANLLAVITGVGQLRLQQLDAAGQAAHLPALEFAQARLLLTASDVRSGADFSRYSATGTLEVAGELLPAEGRVYSHRLHAYRPAALETQAAPPPGMSGSIRISDPLSGEEAMALSFETRERTATTYQGTLRMYDRDKTYEVDLQRSTSAR